MRYQAIQLVSDVMKAPSARHPSRKTSTAVKQTIDFLETVASHLGERVDNLILKKRYGDPTFRVWYSQLDTETSEFLDTLVAGKILLAKLELSTYILSSFGDPSRLDYGTGHELAFCAFLLCCYKIGIFCPDDLHDLGAIIFTKYTDVARKIIVKYSLEPAGSRGSWGLDDYFFLPFYWGSAQLLGQDSQDMFSPAAICDDQLIKLHMGSYMYFASISFITEMKGTPLSITAPLLYDISQLKSWSKINAGLLKMYQAEYLSSLPMMQHFLFGSILVFE